MRQTIRPARRLSGAWTASRIQNYSTGASCHSTPRYVSAPGIEVQQQQGTTVTTCISVPAATRSLKSSRFSVAAASCSAVWPSESGVYGNSRFQDFFDFAGIAAPGSLHQVILTAYRLSDEKAGNQQKIYFLTYTKTDGGGPAMSLILVSAGCTARRRGNPPYAFFDANSFISVGWVIN
jgi:hypothetical protein